MVRRTFSRHYVGVIVKKMPSYECSWAYWMHNSEFLIYHNYNGPAYSRHRSKNRKHDFYAFCGKQLKSQV